MQPCKKCEFKYDHRKAVPYNVSVSFHPVPGIINITMGDKPIITSVSFQVVENCKTLGSPGAQFGSFPADMSDMKQTTGVIQVMI